MPHRSLSAVVVNAYLPVDREGDWRCWTRARRSWPTRGRRCRRTAMAAELSRAGQGGGRQERQHPLSFPPPRPISARRWRVAIARTRAPAWRRSGGARRSRAVPAALCRGLPPRAGRTATACACAASWPPRPGTCPRRCRRKSAPSPISTPNGWRRCWRRRTRTAIPRHAPARARDLRRDRRRPARGAQPGRRRGLRPDRRELSRDGADPGVGPRHPVTIVTDTSANDSAGPVGYGSFREYRAGH